MVAMKQYNDHMLRHVSSSGSKIVEDGVANFNYQKNTQSPASKHNNDNSDIMMMAAIPSYFDDSPGNNFSKDNKFQTSSPSAAKLNTTTNQNMHSNNTSDLNNNDEFDAKAHDYDFSDQKL